MSSIILLVEASVSLTTQLLYLTHQLRVSRLVPLSKFQQAADECGIPTAIAEDYLEHLISNNAVQRVEINHELYLQWQTPMAPDEQVLAE